MLGGAAGRALCSSLVERLSADSLVYKNLIALSPKIDPNVALSRRLVGERLPPAAALRALNAWFAAALRNFVSTRNGLSTDGAAKASIDP